MKVQNFDFLKCPDVFFEVTPSVTYLALIGDTGCVTDSADFGFISKQLSKFKIVFLLLGNQESYHSNWMSAKKKILDFEK